MALQDQRWVLFPPRAISNTACLLRYQLFKDHYSYFPDSVTNGTIFYSSPIIAGSSTPNPRRKIGIHSRRPSTAQTDLQDHETTTAQWQVETKLQTSWPISPNVQGASTLLQGWQQLRMDALSIRSPLP